jgi:excisionase family DNA binding protein
VATQAVTILDSDRFAFSLEVAARKLSVSPSFLRLEIARGRLHPIRLGRRVLIGEAEVVRYLAANATVEDAPASGKRKRLRRSAVRRYQDRRERDDRRRDDD